MIFNMWFGVVTLFPEMFNALHKGITSRALNTQKIQLHCWNPRDFSLDKHASVDDHPYGGGPGMVMMAEPLLAAIKAAKHAAPPPTKAIYLSPQGRKLDQSNVQFLSAHKSLIFVAGRYEGIDQRIIETEIDEEWSIGDYILSGGELAAMVMIDTITRLLPNVLGDPESVLQDSLYHGLLKYPQYTRPQLVNGKEVPKVLLCGDHERIKTWRLKHSLGQTWQKRPDLLAKKNLSPAEEQLLREYIKEFTGNARKIS